MPIPVGAAVSTYPFIMPIPSNDRLLQLNDEFSRLPETFPLCKRWLEKEVSTTRARLDANMCMMNVRIPVPVAHFPDYNFVGRLLGPRGLTIKDMQRQSGCKMFVRGRGTEKPGQEPYKDELHVVISYEGPRDRAAGALAFAERMVRNLLVPPVNDAFNMFKKAQLQEVAIQNGVLDANRDLCAKFNHLACADGQGGIVWR